MAFIICGDFLENPHSYESFSILKKALDKFARKVVELEMRESYFVFVPGASDPCLGDILPRPALPDSVISPYIKQKLKNWHFVSNPCRMTLFSQEIVIFRADIMSKLMRHAIREPSGDLPELTVKTILSQAHLAPFPQRISPIYWGWDHALIRI
jgi:DNA polymerase epsilon subunit 2